MESAKDDRAESTRFDAAESFHILLVGNRSAACTPAPVTLDVLAATSHCEIY